jgi:hypothetical protein
VHPVASSPCSFSNLFLNIKPRLDRVNDVVNGFLLGFPFAVRRQGRTPEKLRVMIQIHRFALDWTAGMRWITWPESVECANE